MTRRAVAGRPRSPSGRASGIAPLAGATASPSREALQHWRDVAFRRVPGRRVRSVAAARALVDAVGICSTYYRFPEGLACLWEAVAGRRAPRWPRHSHHDPDVGLTWELKDVLPARRLVYYGKLLRGRPVLVALDVLPAFYALVRGRQRARDYRSEYAAGRLSHTAKRLMDVMIRQHPLVTRQWRAESFMLDPGTTREFERAVGELQAGLFVAKVEERYEPAFTYRWDLLEAWLPEAVRAGRRLDRPAAVRLLVRRYLDGAGWGSARGLARLFGLAPAAVAAAVAALARTGAIRVGLAVPGLPADLVVSSAAADRLARRRSR